VGLLVKKASWKASRKPSLSCCAACQIDNGRTQSVRCHQRGRGDSWLWGALYVLTRDAASRRRHAASSAPRDPPRAGEAIILRRQGCPAASKAATIIPVRLCEKPVRSRRGVFWPLSAPAPPAAQLLRRAPPHAPLAAAVSRARPAAAPPAGSRAQQRPRRPRRAAARI
jgi:hypothetical protein